MDNEDTRTMSVAWALKKQRASYVESFQYAIGMAIIPALKNADINEIHD